MEKPRKSAVRQTSESGREGALRGERKLENKKPKAIRSKSGRKENLIKRKVEKKMHEI